MTIGASYKASMRISHFETKACCLYIIHVLTGGQMKVPAVTIGQHVCHLKFKGIIPCQQKGVLSQSIAFANQRIMSVLLMYILWLWSKDSHEEEYQNKVLKSLFLSAFLNLMNQGCKNMKGLLVTLVTYLWHIHGSQQLASFCPLQTMQLEKPSGHPVAADKSETDLGNSNSNLHPSIFMHAYVLKFIALELILNHYYPKGLRGASFGVNPKGWFGDQDGGSKEHVVFGMQEALHMEQESALNIQYFIWGTQYMIYMHYLSPVEKTKFGWLPSSTESTQQQNKTTYQEGWNTNMDMIEGQPDN
ncbi:hypothetical protein ACJX0J_041097 [Zea mays]